MMGDSDRFSKPELMYSIFEIETEAIPNPHNKFHNAPRYSLFKAIS